jgi:hypothetical protein
MLACKMKESVALLIYVRYKVVIFTVQNQAQSVKQT